MTSSRPCTVPNVSTLATHPPRKIFSNFLVFFKNGANKQSLNGQLTCCPVLVPNVSSRAVLDNVIDKTTWSSGPDVIEISLVLHGRGQQFYVLDAKVLTDIDDSQNLCALSVFFSDVNRRDCTVQAGARVTPVKARVKLHGREESE